MTANACRSCRAPVWFAINDRTGNKMILDDQTYPDGNVVIVGSNGTDAVVHVLTKKEVDASAPALPGLAPVDVPLDDKPRYKDHHVTCPDRDKWRR